MPPQTVDKMRPGYWMDRAIWAERMLAEVLIAKACQGHPVAPDSDPQISVRMTDDNRTIIIRTNDGDKVKATLENVEQRLLEIIDTMHRRHETLVG